MHNQKHFDLTERGYKTYYGCTIYEASYKANGYYKRQRLNPAISKTPLSKLVKDVNDHQIHRKDTLVSCTAKETDTHASNMTNP
jgi:hypothetical protein